jgi:hypothetical protein
MESGPACLVLSFSSRLALKERECWFFPFSISSIEYRYSLPIRPSFLFFPFFFSLFFSQRFVSDRVAISHHIYAPVSRLVSLVACVPPLSYYIPYRIVSYPYYNP